MAKKKKSKSKTKTKVGKFLKGAKETLKKAGSNIKFAPLVPFVPFMKIMLKGRNVSSTSIEDTTEKFYNTFIKGKGKKFDEMNSDFDSVEMNFDENTELDFNAIPVAVLVVVIPAIIEFIKMLKEKKEKGIPLTKEEEQGLALVEEAEEKIKDLAEDNIADSIKDFIFSPVGIVVIVVVVAGVIYLIYYRSK